MVTGLHSALRCCRVETGSQTDSPARASAPTGECSERLEGYVPEVRQVGMVSNMNALGTRLRLMARGVQPFSVNGQAIDGPPGRQRPWLPSRPSTHTPTNRLRRKSSVDGDDETADVGSGWRVPGPHVRKVDNDVAAALCSHDDDRTFEFNPHHARRFGALDPPDMI